MSAPTGRIGVAVDQLGGGGAQRSATLVASRLHELGVQTTLLSGLGGTYASDLRERLPVRILAPHWPRPWGVASFILGLCRQTRRNRIDVLFASGFAVSRIALLLRATSPVGLGRMTKVVVVEQNTLSAAVQNRFPNRIVRRMVLHLTRWLYRRADAIVGVSRGVSRDLEETLGLPHGEVVTIFNPVDADRIREAVSGAVAGDLEASFGALQRPVVITAGRLVAQKAQRDLIDAFSRLPDDQLGSLVILGEGPLEAELKMQAKVLGVNSRLWMPGFVKNPWWFIARSDLFALSSHWEGHPLVLLEALSCGVPVVSTDCPSGPGEILKGVAHARLAPPGDLEAFAGAMSELLAKASAGTAQADAAFSVEAVALQYRELAEAVRRR